MEQPTSPYPAHRRADHIHELIQRVQADQDASHIAPLACLMRPCIRAWAASRTIPGMTGEDLDQESVIILYQLCLRFEFDRGVHPIHFLSVGLRGALQNLARQASRVACREISSQGLQVLEMFADGTQDGRAVADRICDDSRLQTALGLLDRDDCAILALLAAGQGHTYIACRLGLTLVNSRKRAQRARGRLQEVLCHGDPPLEPPDEMC